MLRDAEKGGQTAMREIDNRFPEYARPYEPLRRGRRFSRLTGNEAALYQRRAARKNLMRKYFTTGAATLIAFAVISRKEYRTMAVK